MRNIPELYRVKGENIIIPVGFGRHTKLFGGKAIRLGTHWNIASTNSMAEISLSVKCEGPLVLTPILKQYPNAGSEGIAGYKVECARCGISRNFSRRLENSEPYAREQFDLELYQMLRYTLFARKLGPNPFNCQASSYVQDVSGETPYWIGCLLMANEKYSASLNLGLVSTADDDLGVQAVLGGDKFMLDFFQTTHTSSDMIGERIKKFKRKIDLDRK